jgi:hypothetical protein
MANKPIRFNNDVLVVDTGVPINVNGSPAIVLRREAKTIQELKTGRLALRPRQAGFARQERCLLYRDEEANYHYLYNSDALKDQLYVKSPAASPEYLPQSDLVGTLRYVHSKDCYYMLTGKEDGGKEWVPITSLTDKRLDEEIARAIARENSIEQKAQGINVTDNKNGSLTFTNYDGKESVIPTGKSVQSSDGTVEVAENANDFDLSVQPAIDKAQGIGIVDNQDGTFSFTNYNGETTNINPNPDLLVASDDMEAVATPTSLSITGKWTNLKSRLKTPLSLSVPASNDNQTGVLTAEDHSALTKAVADIIELWALVRAGTGRLVITQLPDNPTQQDISDAFNLVYPGDIYDKDTVIDTSNGGFEWIHSNGTWINLTEQPIPIATNSTLGVVKGDAQDGKVYVELDGTQSVYGWDDLKTAVGNMASKMNASYVYGASVSGNKLTINFRNIFTGSETATAIDLPNAFTNVSYSGNTLTFTKADGTTQAQAITLAMGDVEGLGDALAGKQDKLTAGANITIEGSTISATVGNATLPTIPASELDNLNLVNANESRKFLVSNINYPGASFNGLAVVEVTRNDSNNEDVNITQTAYFLRYYTNTAYITMRRSYGRELTTTAPAAWSDWSRLFPYPSGDPMQLVKGTGSLTEGYAEFRHILSGIYSNAPSIPSASCYMIMMDSSKKNVSIITQETSCGAILSIHGTRNDVTSPFTFNYGWERCLNTYDKTQLAGWFTSYPVINNTITTNQYNTYLKYNTAIKLCVLYIDIQTNASTSIASLLRLDAMFTSNIPVTYGLISNGAGSTIQVHLNPITGAVENQNVITAGRWRGQLIWNYK